MTAAGNLGVQETRQTRDAKRRMENGEDDLDKYLSHKSPGIDGIFLIPELLRPKPSTTFDRLLRRDRIRRLDKPACRVS